MILRALNSTIDYILFTFGFIIAIQLPEFVQQYKQYIAGKLSESNWHLSGYQNIADKSFNGDVQVLINEYLKSGQLALQETGHFVTELVQRNNELKTLVAKLDNESYFQQLMAFASNFNKEDTQVVLSYYQLAIPLTIEAIASGFILAFLFIWLKMLVSATLHKLLFSRPVTHP